jgi:hypothetical protein
MTELASVLAGASVGRMPRCDCIFTGNSGVGIRPRVQAGPSSAGESQRRKVKLKKNLLKLAFAAAMLAVPLPSLAFPHRAGRVVRVGDSPKDAKFAWWSAYQGPFRTLKV